VDDDDVEEEEEEEEGEKRLPVGGAAILAGIFNRFPLGSALSFEERFDCREWMEDTHV